MARRLIEVESESDVTPSAEERLDFDDDTLRGDEKCLKKIDWMKISQKHRRDLPYSSTFLGSRGCYVTVRNPNAYFEKHFKYIILWLFLFLCLITFFWFIFLLKMSSFLTVTLKSVFIFGQTMSAPIFTSELRWQKAISCPSSQVTNWGPRPHPFRYEWLLNNFGF